MVLWGIWDFPDMILSARAEALGITNKECHCVNKMSSRQQIDCMNGIVSPHKHVCIYINWYSLSYKRHQFIPHECEALQAILQTCMYAQISFPSKVSVVFSVYRLQLTQRTHHFSSS